MAYLCVVLVQLGATLAFASVLAGASYWIPGWLGAFGLLAGFGLWICAVKLDETYPSVWTERESTKGKRGSAWR